MFDLGSHLVHMDVVVVGGVVDGFEETLELTRRATVDDQHKGDPYRHVGSSFRAVLIPLYVHISFTWRETTADRSIKGFSQLKLSLIHLHLSSSKKI